MSAPLLEAYSRSITGSRFRFVWHYYRGAHVPNERARDAWFTYWERSNWERECSHCGAQIAKHQPCWVSGETGFVLCVQCPVFNDEVELVQSGTFHASFVPAEAA